MNSTEELTGASNKTDEADTSFEDWAEQFRNSLKEREESIEQFTAATEEKEDEKKYNRLFFVVTVLAGVLFVTLSLLRIL